MIVNIIILAIFLLFLIIGFVKGFLKQVISIGGTILAIVLASTFCGTLVDLVVKNTELFSNLQNAISEHIPTIDKAVIETFPAFLKEIFAPILNDATDALSTVAANLTSLIFNVIAFIVIFLVVKLVVFLLGKILNAIFSKNVLGFINRFLGGLFGILKGFILVSALLFLCEVIVIPIVPEVSEYIAESTIAKYITDVNVFGYIFKLLGF